VCRFAFDLLPLNYVDIGQSGIYKMFHPEEHGWHHAFSLYHPERGTPQNGQDLSASRVHPSASAGGTICAAVSAAVCGRISDQVAAYRNAREAYRNISFEREAYDNEANYDYLKTRKWLAFTKYW